MTDAVDDFLEHFGVKGMRWGVRKERESSPKSSKELVKAAKTNYRKLTDAALETRINQLFEVDTTIDPTKLSNRGRTIKSGRNFYRVTKQKNKDYFDTPFVSANSSDRKTYRGVMANLFGVTLAKRSYSSTYEMVLKSTKDFKLPSEKTRFDAFVDLMDQPLIKLRNGKDITGREYLKRSGYRKEVKTMDSVALGARFYQSFVSKQTEKTPINSAYFKRVRDLGYDALTDDNDKNIVSRDPLILLNPKETTSLISVRQLTNDEINTALATLKIPPKLMEQNQKGGN